MPKNSKKRGRNNDFAIDKILAEEKSHIEHLKKTVSYFQDKYNLSSDEVIKLLKAQTELPISIFCKELTIFESIVKYLKEEKSISFHDIALLLSRDERNVWHTYDNAKKKIKGKLDLHASGISIPISIFKKYELSVLATVIFYLKEELKLSYHKIAVLLKRDDRTIWTVYNRAKK